MGAFSYDTTGFTLYYEEISKRYEWDAITQINVFKRDLLTVDRIEIEIEVGDRFFTITEDLPGWYQFLIKTKEVFPAIPKDWDSVIETCFYEELFCYL